MLKKISAGYVPTKVELAEILGSPEEKFTEFYELAQDICYKTKGKKVKIRGIIEFSNYCKRHCAYCGLNADHRSLERYRMEPKDIVDTAIEAYEAGYKTIVLQSGEDPYYTWDLICQIVKDIKANTDVAITLSVGERQLWEYELFKNCGADRYLLKHETSDPELYSSLHPCGTLENRIACLKEIKRLGYETGSGFMIGLPNQTKEIIASDILLLKEIGCDMAGIGPFVPNPATSLGKFPAGSPGLVKRAVALTRIIMPDIMLPATTSLEVTDSKAKKQVFSCGADVIMKKVTPLKYRSLYEIYPSKGFGQNDIKTDRQILEEYIRKLDRIPI